MGFSQTTRTHAHLICVNKNNLCFSIIGVSVDDRNKGDIPWAWDPQFILKSGSA